MSIHGVGNNNDQSYYSQSKIGDNNKYDPSQIDIFKASNDGGKTNNNNNTEVPLAYSDPKKELKNYHPIPTEHTNDGPITPKNINKAYKEKSGRTEAFLKLVREKSPLGDKNLDLNRLGPVKSEARNGDKYYENNVVMSEILHDDAPEGAVKRGFFMSGGLIQEMYYGANGELIKGSLTIHTKDDETSVITIERNYNEQNDPNAPDFYVKSSENLLNF